MSDQTATLQFKKIAQHNVQLCPFCQMPQEGIINGMRLRNEKEYETVTDKWYSFCNCKNIFFTNWDNMEQDIYDASYQKKYEDERFQKNIRGIAKPVFDEITKKEGMFIEIGVAHDAVLDEAIARGYDVLGIDINSAVESKHMVLVGNIEDKAFMDNEVPNADVIWAAHVVEHLRHPIEAMKALYDKLNHGGCLHVAMPDPYMIPIGNPHLWAHWHYREHHIMWDMDSFIDEMLNLGFELVSSRRRAITTDYVIIFRKP